MKINILDTISLHTPEKYILTVYVHPEKFSFSLHRPDDPKSYFVYKIDSTERSDAFSVFKDLFFDNDFFTYPFQRTYILVFSSLFTFVPNAIYSNQYKDDFIQFIFSEKKDKFLDHSISFLKLRVLYSISETVYDFFIRSFNHPEFIHHLTPLITYFGHSNTKYENRRMIINIHEKGVDIVCFSGQLFIFGNHFPCEKYQDAIYYILYTWKQLKMDRYSDVLYVSGLYEQNKELIRELKLYIQQVCPKPIPEACRFDTRIKNIPFELAIFSLCES
jgi:hypothetical protein